MSSVGLHGLDDATPERIAHGSTQTPKSQKQLKPLRPSYGEVCEQEGQDSDGGARVVVSVESTVLPGYDPPRSNVLCLRETGGLSKHWPEK